MLREFTQLGTLAAVIVGTLFAPTASLAARYNTRIEFGIGTLEPLGHTQFCSRYPRECASFDSSRIHEGSKPRETMDQLETVNRAINQHITPTHKYVRGPIENWRLNPNVGDCTDFAVTKRHDLLAQGWPSEALLLAEVRLRSTGEHHLVLVARTEKADLVLDNLQQRIRNFSETLADYQWLRIQSSDNPRFWNSVEMSHG
jgi:predicted transglutaminase-like cysteine proteinase